jgi:5-(carboxyamino)imidazole ribonucleotide synthase
MTNTIHPGGTIGILGGGPMGRMIALAARALGYRVRALDTDAAYTSAGLADFSVTSHRLDTRAAAEVVRGCDVVTVAFEDVPEQVLEVADAHALLRPGLRQLAIAQERKREREWLQRAGFGVVPWRAADSRDELVAAIAALGAPCVVKPRTRRRADFRPLLVTSEREAYAAWIAVRGVPTVVESFVSIDVELTVLAARSPDGAVRAYPPVVSLREGMELAWSGLPGELSPQLAQKAQDLGTYMARKLEIEGLLTVEMFLLSDGRLVVNELVPCPHPTYYAAEVACATDQFEQLARSISGLPLGSTALFQPAVCMSLLGSPRGSPVMWGLDRALQVPGVSAHLYDAAEPLPGRPVGHLCATGATLDEATARVLLALAQLDPRRARHLSRYRRQLVGGGAPVRRRRGAALPPDAGGSQHGVATAI